MTDEAAPTKADAIRLAEEPRTKVTVIQCPLCFDIVYSRARHDMRYCDCGKVAIDGGFDYSKISLHPDLGDLVVEARTFYILVPHTRQQIREDFYYHHDKLGVIRLQKPPRKKRKSH